MTCPYFDLRNKKIIFPSFIYWFNKIYQIIAVSKSFESLRLSHKMSLDLANIFWIDSKWDFEILKSVTFTSFRKSKRILYPGSFGLRPIWSNNLNRIFLDDVWLSKRLIFIGLFKFVVDSMLKCWNFKLSEIIQMARLFGFGSLVSNRYRPCCRRAKISKWLFWESIKISLFHK